MLNSKSAAATRAGLLALVGTVGLVAPALSQQYDVLIRGGRVLDGTGNPWYYADVAIAGDRVAAVGDLSVASAPRVIDARGLYVAPGFIDVHSHSGPGLATPGLAHGQPLLAQGITTVVINPDGGGSVDLVEQRAELQRNGLGLNVALMVPHGSVRRAVLGMADRAPNPQELERMKALVSAGMQAGAFGLSSGPYYAPGSYSTTEELVELSRVAGRQGGVYTSHIRDESDYSVGLIAAVEEVIRIARDAAMPGIVTHVKAMGPHVWGFGEAIVKRIERAREQGVQVFADQYPYAASQTGLDAALLPRWAQAGGADSLLRRIDDPSLRDRMRTEMAENLDRRGGADRIQFSSYDRDRSIEGKTLQQIARERNSDPIDVALEMFRAGEGPGIVSFNMDESDVVALMRQPWTITASDGQLVPMGEGVPHPRAYGTFPRKIRRYVVEQEVVDLAHAIRSMTSLPATVFRMRDRGQLRADAAADVVVFDLTRVRDNATYDKPHQLSEGMVHVLVNGKLVIDNGRLTGERPGRVLDRRARSGSVSGGS